MRVLVVGGGGREHALCWKLARSPMLGKLWCAPGNPGTAMCAENVAIDTLDIAGLVAFARDNAVDLVLPGGEPPLVAGIADAMDAAGIACCGPSSAAAQLEGKPSMMNPQGGKTNTMPGMDMSGDDKSKNEQKMNKKNIPVHSKTKNEQSMPGMDMPGDKK